MVRAAHPYRDLAVIDARAPLFNQIVVAIVASVAVVTSSGWLLLAMGAQLSLGLLFGRRFCLPCVAYFELVQPRFGEGPLEDARAPRFANIIGAFVLNAGALAYFVGAPRVGFGLGLLVAILATLAATTGLCVGCEVYRFLARLRGVREGVVERIDLEQLGVVGDSDVVVQFTHPLCTDCIALERRLRSEGRSVVRIDVSKRADLARKYGVRLVPFALAVRGDGLVLGQLK